MLREHIDELMIPLECHDNADTDHIPTKTGLDGVEILCNIGESYYIDNDNGCLTQHWYEKNNILGYKALKILPTRGGIFNHVMREVLQSPPGSPFGTLVQHENITNLRKLILTGSNGGTSKTEEK